MTNISNRQFSLLSNWRSIFLIFLGLWFLPASAQWKFVKQVDKFTGIDSSHIRLKSKNSQPVGFNSKATIAEIIVFESPDENTFKAALMFSQHSLPVSFSYHVDICIGSYTCQASIKIDGGEILQIPIVDSGKGDSAFVYMRIPNDEVVKSLIEAKKIEIRVEFYNKGNGDFIFFSNGKNALTK